jgi:flavin reductase (DIM6/NTAB) family NADH-FMN oxidoreductase RutF
MKQVNLKEAFGRIKPESVAFVLSVDEANKPSGMIVAWHTKLSNEPPLIGVAISKRKYTHELITKSKEFVVVFPGKGLEAELKIFGSVSGREVDKFKETKIKTEPAKHIQTPLLIDAVINFECKLHQIIETGDHDLFIGEILTSYIDEDKKILFDTERNGEERIYKEF